jgi:hypothetical protein
MKTLSYAQRFDMPSFTRSSDGGKMPNDTGWQTRHLAALQTPKGFESAIVGLIRAWAIYADSHKARYDSGIGEDGLLGDFWSQMSKQLRGLLDGETGRLDCGTLATFISETLKAEGFDPDTL